MDLDWDNLDAVTSVPTQAPSNLLTMEEAEKQYGDRDVTYAELENLVRSRLAELPVLQYNDLRDEMQNMLHKVEIVPNPTTFQLSESLANAQGYICRVSEIINILETEYSTRKTVLDMLFDANQTVSKLSSIDKRKGEATLRYPVLKLKLNDISILKNHATNVLNTLRSAKEVLSRQQSIIDSQIALGEYRKKMPSDFNNSLENEGKDYKSGVINKWDD